MAELNSMRNIGRIIAQKLESAGINSAEELMQVGSKDAFLRIKAHDPGACLMLLYSLQGAIDNIEYNRLSDEVKHNLISFHDKLK